MSRYLQFIITSVFLFFITVATAYAQPTLVLGNATIPSESIGTIDVSVMDFTDITKTQYSINWNTDELEFSGITNINTTNGLNLSEANLDISDVANGNLVFSWEDPNGQGMTLPDGMQFYSIEFKALIPEGGIANVRYSNSPTEIVINRTASGDTNIFDPDMVPPTNGIITASAPIPDVFFSFSPQENKSTFCKGDQICYDIKVAEFENLGVTAFIRWDTNTLKYSDNNATPLNDNVQVNTVYDSVAMEYADIAAVLILTSDFGTVSIPDSTVIFSICFDVTGEPENSTTIGFVKDDDSLPTEIFNDAGEFLDLVPLNEPTITITDCQSLIIFSTECQDIRPDETLCIDFTTSNFTDISRVKYTVTYDATLLEFVNSDKYNLPGLDASNITAENGLLTLDWTGANGETLANGDFLFSACFKAIGPIDSISQLNYIPIVGTSVGHEIIKSDGEQLESPQFNNCEIKILPPTISLSLPSTSAPPGEEICLPLTVTNFLNIDHIEMPIEWDPAVLEFVTINSTGLTDLTLDDFDTVNIANGKLQLVTWDSPNVSGITLMDGASIFEICFKVIGNLGDESPVSFPNAEDNPVFIRNNNAQEPGVDITDGLVNVAAGGLILSSESKVVKEDESVCVDIEVSNFQDMVSIDYTHTYDPTAFRFDSVQVSGALTDLSPTDIVLIEPGSIKVIWLSSDPSGATSLADDTPIYSLCFTPIGELGACANLNLGETIEVTTLESAGTDVGIFNRLSNLCIDNFGLTLIDSLLPTCEGGDGLLNIKVGGDENEQFFYFVTKDNASFVNNEDVTDNTILLENLSEGEYCIILNSLTNPSKSNTKCFKLILGPEDLPSITLGEDIDAGCVDPTTELNIPIDGSQFTLPQNTGSIFSTEWVTMNGGQIPEGEENEQMSTAQAPGTYIFTVTINATKCVASDTLVVFTTQPPRVQVSPGGTLGCANSTFQLGLDVIDENPNNIYFWTTDIGNFVSDSTAFDPVVDKEGIYKFTVLDTVNGCFGVDSTFIFEDRIKPNADAGPDLEMGCTDPFLSLTGIGSNGAETEWTTTDGSSIFYPDANDQSTAFVSRVGTYIFTATNQVNGCMASDTMIINADNSLPVARVDDLAIIGCDATEVKLDGSNSSQGPSFVYRWVDSANEVISDEDTIVASTPGNYLLIVTNIDNDDCISDTVTVEVREDKTAPEASITEVLSLTCMSNCTALNANVPAGDNYTYEWTSEDGIFCEGENTPTALINSIGVYKILVTDLSNNCTSTAAAIVGGDGTEIFADPGPDRQLNCLADLVTLDGRGSTTGDNVSYSWKTAEGVEISTEITAAVTEAGDYTLEIMDSETGCNASGKVAVTVDETKPVAIAGAAPEVTGCIFPTGRRLNGNESDRGENIKYAWTSTSGNLVGDTTIAAPEISGPGLFILTVTNTTNGCVSTDEVDVQSDVLIPIANAGADIMLTCDNPMTTLAGISESPVMGSTINWTTVDGVIDGETGQLSINVEAPGTYVLTITSPDGCDGTDEVVVSSNVEAPMANAGESRTITCNNPLIINGFGETGDNIDIAWTTTGGNILSGADTYTPEVDRGGSYTLTVTNTTNNCTNTALVLITASEPLPEAIAGVDQEICRNEAVLSAEAVTGDFTGVWTTLENSLVVSPEDPNTAVADLESGVNTYIWTLSNSTCGAFSSDTIVINLPNAPIAADDAFEIQAGSNLNTLDILQNDQTSSDNLGISILEQPTTGGITDLGNGTVEFTFPTRYFGTQQFIYEVCNQTCIDLCDEAIARVVVLPGIGVDTTNTVPNAITPNGDGKNDLLIIDELIFDALDFPRSELIIFNRWGDIVFNASPYNNDWGGKSNGGVDLPEGTYYYVLRLDTVEGEVMKGDITILR